MNAANTVLCVGNEPVRTQICHTLRGAGISVCEAATSSEAVQLAGERPALILIDVSQCDPADFDLCQRLKTDPDTSLIPVLLYCNCFLEADAWVRGEECGADGFLTESMAPAEKVAYVRAWLRIRRAEEQVRAAGAERERLLEQFRLQVERMPIGCIMYDPEMRYTDWNPAAEKIFGYTREEILGQPLLVLVPPTARAQVEAVVQRLRTGDMVAHCINQNVTKEGNLITCESYNTPLRRADGTFEGALSMVVDITERVRLEEQLRQSQKIEAIGQLAGGVAHDFNNMLTAILGYASLLRRAVAPDTPAHELATHILAVGERSAGLVRQLLAFSRKQLLAPQMLDLNAVIQDLEKMLRRVLGEDVELVTELQPGLGPVKADPGQLGQVLLNLALNARDAMPRGGRLAVETRNVDLGLADTRGRQDLQPGPYVLLTVSDTGCGMDEAIKAHIFEPFFTTKPVGQGTGLGLATVYGIITQSGGHLEVLSEPGLGTVFKVYLPRAGGPVTVEPARSVLQPAVGGHEIVLLVEDEELVRAVARRVLQECGYTVLEAADGAEALRVVRQYAGRIDLLVTDVIMPGVGGPELAERLVRRYPRLKVLFLSGYTDDERVRNGVAELGVSFLAKPFLPDELARKVRKVLDALPLAR